MKIRCLCDLKVTSNFAGRTLTEAPAKQEQKAMERVSGRKSKRKRKEREGP